MTERSKDELARRRERYQRDKAAGKSVRGASGKNLPGPRNHGKSGPSGPSGRHKPKPFAAVTYAVDHDADGRGYLSWLDISSRRLPAPSTIVALDWLLADDSMTLVGWHIARLVNLILADVPVHRLKQIAGEGKCYWHAKRGTVYRIEYQTGKRLILSRGWFVGNEWRREASCTIYDLADFRKGKGLREIQAITGQTDLAALAEELRAELRDHNIRPAAWYGAGALASYWWHKWEIQNYVDHPDEPAVEDAVRRGYFGGRIWAGYLGKFPKAYKYDLRSACPWALTRLKPLSAIWPHLRDWNEKSETIDVPSIWHLRWNLTSQVDTRTFPMPFPVRDRLGYVKYPIMGEGWYWRPEVEAAIKHLEIEVIEGYEQKDLPPGEPFHRLPYLYALRKAYERTGNQWVAGAIKGGLQAIHGKCLQATSYAGATPAWQTYEWGGIIMSLLRGRLLEAMYQAPNEIIATMTDGFFSYEKLDLPLGDDMGKWDEVECRDLFIYHHGIWEYTEATTGEIKRATRSFRPNELDFEFLRTLWDKNGSLSFTDIPVERFYGLMLCNLTGEWSKWRTTEAIMQKLRPATDRSALDALIGRENRLQSELCPPAIHNGGSLSERYKTHAELTEVEEMVYELAMIADNPEIEDRSD